MNDIDREIRRLFEELDEGTPQVPPMPRLEPVQRKRWLWILAPATAVAVVILFVGLAVNLVPSDNDDAASADTTIAAAQTTTTAAAAETITTVAAETTTTAAAAETTEAPSPTTQAPTTITPEEAEAALTSTCEAFAEEVDSLADDSIEDPAAYYETLEQLIEPAAQLAVSLNQVAARLQDPAFDPIALQGTVVVRVLEESLESPVDQAPGWYAVVVLQFDLLENLVVDYGADGCTELAAPLR